jgi:hypothetical protein
MRRPGVTTLLLVLAAVFLALPATASALRLDRVAGGFSSPVGVATSPRDGTLYVVERDGRVWRLAHGRRNLFLGIRGLVASGGERGLLSIAFPRNYAQSRFFYVNYTQNGGDVRVARFRANASFTKVRRGTRRMLLRVEHSANDNHNGGLVTFGPNGRLYASIGDGGGSCDPSGNAQNLRSHKGKLLSIDTGNLAAGWRIDGYGLRNLWRYSFDRANGRLYAADVGQGAWEEVNSIAASRLGGTPENYLWDRYEGRAGSGCSTGGLRGPGDHVRPKHVYAHAESNCSVTGGFVYRGSILRRSLRGWYFFADFCTGRIWRMKLSSSGRVARRARLVMDTDLNVSSFGERRSGEILVVDLGGTIYRLAPS